MFDEDEDGLYQSKLKARDIYTKSEDLWGQMSSERQAKQIEHESLREEGERLAKEADRLAYPPVEGIQDEADFYDIANPDSLKQMKNFEFRPDEEGKLQFFDKKEKYERDDFYEKVGGDVLRRMEDLKFKPGQRSRYAFFQNKEDEKRAMYRTIKIKYVYPDGRPAGYGYEYKKIGTKEATSGRWSTGRKIMDD